MATVTFYKTKMNRSNRAYDGAALDNILTAASALTVNITPEVIPDTPFAIISANNDNITASDIVLGGYDYISYSYGGKTWYAFIDDVQALATSVGNFFVYHTVDKWAMCVKYFTATFHMQGAVERAHVNDINNAGENSGTKDMSYTTATPEAPYNKMLLKRYKSEANDYNGWWYLYIYIANPREAGVSEEQLLSQAQEIDDKIITNTGLLCVYPAYVSGSDINYICYNNNKDFNAGNPFTEDNLQRLSNLTSSAITGMTLSRIPPVTGNGTIGSTEYRYGIKSLTIGETAYNLPVWENSYLTKFKVLKTEPSDGMPPYLNYFMNMSGTAVAAQPTELTGIDEDITLTQVNKESTFSAYLNTIPKMNSRIYNPLYIAGELNYCEDGNSNITNIRMCYSLDLKYIIVQMYNNYIEGSFKIKYLPNNDLFAPNATIDYWTKLNAEQMGIQAQSNKFNAIVGGIFAPIKGAIGGALAGTATQGKHQSSANYKSAITGGIAGSVMSTVSGVGNAVYAAKSADNMQEIADRQYNCGETNEYNTTGLLVSLFSRSVNIIEQYTIEEQKDVIAPNLHRMGYNTFLQIDEIYNNHKRKYFNYFKGADVSVSGMPQNWSEDIENMFNNGVTLWQSDVENYKRLNYPQNTGW